MLNAFSKYVSGYLLPNNGKTEQVSPSLKCPSGSTEIITLPEPQPLSEILPEARLDDNDEWVFVSDSDDDFDSGLFEEETRLIRPLGQWEDASLSAYAASHRRHGNADVNHLIGRPDSSNLEAAVLTGKDGADEGIHSPMNLSLRDNLDLNFHDRWDRRDRKKTKVRNYNMTLREAARRQRVDKAMERVSISSSGGADEYEPADGHDTLLAAGKLKRDRRGGKKKISHRAGIEMPKYHQNLMQEGASAMEFNRTNLSDVTNQEGPTPDLAQGSSKFMNVKKQRALKKTLSPKYAPRFDGQNTVLDENCGGDKENVKQKISFFYKNRSAKRSVVTPKGRKSC